MAKISKSIQLIFQLINLAVAFKITGISPKSDGVAVWVDTSGADQRIRLNYSVIELFPSDQYSPGISGNFDDLKSAFTINGLKPDTWYGLHLSTVYSWRGSQYIDPAHDVAFKTLSNDSSNSTGTDAATTPILIAAKPISGGFRLLAINRLGDRLQTPASAYVTSACTGNQNYGGLFTFSSDQSSRQTRDFALNSTQLPEEILRKNSTSWAVDSCQTVCWSLFVNPKNVSYVLDSQCVNLTEVFTNTANDEALWDEGENQDQQTEPASLSDQNIDTSTKRNRSGSSSVRDNIFPIVILVGVLLFVQCGPNVL